MADKLLIFRIIHIFRILPVLAVVFWFQACSPDDPVSGDQVRLAFSTDTVSFDTIFTRTGSVTKRFMVYNQTDKPVRIEKVALAGNNTYFRMNVNGVSGRSITAVEMPAHDSIYVFVEVTVDPAEQNQPMVVHDSIVFTSGGSIWDVDLVAYAQDVHLIKDSIMNTTTWENDKPYLVANYLFVDTNQTLTIKEGCRIHFQRDATMYVAGTLEVEGTPDSTVKFLGERLEAKYQDVPGQWNGIVLLTGSQGHYMLNAEIYNAVIGINIGYLINDVVPTLQLHNCRLMHHSYAGIYAIGAQIFATNCLIADCGYYSAALVVGGAYMFSHCTFANYWSHTQRVQREPSFYLTNHLVVSQDGETVIYTGSLSDATFINCVIDGKQANELKFGILEDYAFNYFFDHCALRVDTPDFADPMTDPAHYLNVVKIGALDKVFVNPAMEEYDYRPDTTGSVLTDMGSSLIISQYPEFLTFDLDNLLRSDPPDIGALELPSETEGTTQK